MHRIVAAIAIMLGGAAAAEPVDVELVFAVDTSRSMDQDEQILQREGYAQALTDPRVFEAIRSGPLQKVAIAYLEWGGPWSQRVVLDWTIIRTREDAELAATILRAPPIESASGTSISGGLRKAAEMIENNAYVGDRMVIDVSGDGPNNTGEPVVPVRDALLEAGFEINGLPIMIKRPGGLFNIEDLDVYYQDCVVGGHAAFVVPVRAKEEFIPAIRRKLVLELSGRAPAEARLIPAAGTDCLIGEKRRRNWLIYQDGN